MIRDINNLGSQPKVDQRPGNNAQRGLSTESSATGAGGIASDSSDQVQLSNEVQRLQAAEAQIQELPEVNAARVAEIKTALASNNFQVNDLIVADKLLGLDSLL